MPFDCPSSYSSLFYYFYEINQGIFMVYFVLLKERSMSSIAAPISYFSAFAKISSCLSNHLSTPVPPNSALPKLNRCKDINAQCFLQQLQLVHPIFCLVCMTLLNLRCIQISQELYGRGPTLGPHLMSGMCGSAELHNYTQISQELYGRGPTLGPPNSLSG